MKNTISKLISHSASCILHFFFFLLSSAFLILNSEFSSAQEIEWQKTFGGSNTDELHSVSQTADGGYILGGISNSDSSGNKMENSIGSIDYWIIKTNQIGNIEWQKTIGGTNVDWISSAKQTTDGGYILGGWSNSPISGNKTDSCRGDFDYWVVKINSFGIVEWDKTIGGNNNDRLTSIDQTADGGFILMGYSLSNISGDKTENSNGSYDYWLVKINSLGNIVWQNTIGGSDSEEAENTHKLLTFDGGFIFGGRSFSNISGDKTENSNGLADYWLIKADSLGNIQWQKTFGGNSDDRLLSIEQTNDQGYILGGISASNISGDKIENSQGSYDFWIIKTDSIGNLLWQNTIGANDGEHKCSIIETTDGNYLLAGSTISPDISGDKTEKSVVTDGWAIKIDSNGSVVWHNIIQGNGWDDIYSISQTTGGDIILGLCSNSGIGYDKTEPCIGSNSHDYWIVKLTNTYNSITGKVFIDLNSNNTKDANEPWLTQNKITEQTTGRFAFTEQNGNYSVAVLDTGTFTVAPSLTGINYYNPVPVTHTATFTGINQTDSLNDFAFQPTGVFNDLCVTITPTGPFRSGFNASYVINYENVGTTNLSGNVIFFPWSNVTYIGANVTPTSISADSIVWNTGVLAPFQSGSITVTVAVNVGLPIGTLINSSVRIEPVAGDANPGCNYHSWEVYTIGSYDPNDILVSQDTILTTQLPSAPWLDYTIRFQNTGNDTAFTIKVLNPIDTNFLNLSTIEFVNSSHPVNLNYIPWERNMQFTFNNILLPDSNINEPLSHGFVHYRIKPKTTLQSGDSILNNAFIYFDFNVPVATNTVSTLITNPTSIFNIQHSTFNIKIVPNPSKEEITISGYHLNKGASAAVKIVDVMGKEVYNTSVTTLNIKLQTLNFSSGVYFVEVSSGNSISRARFVKQ